MSSYVSFVVYACVTMDRHCVDVLRTCVFDAAVFGWEETEVLYN